MYFLSEFRSDDVAVRFRCQLCQKHDITRAKRIYLLHNAYILSYLAFPRKLCDFRYTSRTLRIPFGETVSRKKKNYPLRTAEERQKHNSPALQNPKRKNTDFQLKYEYKKAARDRFGVRVIIMQEALYKLFAKVEI